MFFTLLTASTALPDPVETLWSERADEVAALAEAAAAGCETGEPALATDQPWMLECRIENEGALMDVVLYGAPTRTKTRTGESDGPSGVAYPSALLADGADVAHEVAWSRGTARLWVAYPVDLPDELKTRGRVRITSMSLKGLDRTWIEGQLEGLGDCVYTQSGSLEARLSVKHTLSVVVTSNSAHPEVDTCIVQTLKSSELGELNGSAVVSLSFSPE